MTKIMRHCRFKVLVGPVVVFAYHNSYMLPTVVTPDELKLSDGGW